MQKDKMSLNELKFSDEVECFVYNKNTYGIRKVKNCRLFRTKQPEDLKFIKWEYFKKPKNNKS